MEQHLGYALKTETDSPAVHAGDVEPAVFSVYFRGDILEEGESAGVLHFSDSEDEEEIEFNHEDCIVHDQLICTLAEAKDDDLEEELDGLPERLMQDDIVEAQAKDQFCQMIRGRVENKERIPYWPSMYLDC